MNRLVREWIYDPVHKIYRMVFIELTPEKAKKYKHVSDPLAPSSKRQQLLRDRFPDKATLRQQGLQRLARLMQDDDADDDPQR